MKQKTKQIKKLTAYFLNKFGSANILVTDYWDGDNKAIGLTDKTMQFVVYIAELAEDSFFVSLEYPSSSDEMPYTPGEEYNNIAANEVEAILVKHLKISE